MSDNERGFHHPHAIDKGIMRGLHDVNCVPCPEMPPGTSLAHRSMPIRMAAASKCRSAICRVLRGQ